MKEYIKTHKLESLVFTILLVSSFILRFVNLGYSDYQGDEIKALWLPKEEQTTSEFLLNQRKGPMQFITTLSVKYLSNNYDSYIVTRFPFALAGLLSVFIVFKIVYLHTKSKVASYSSAFLFSYNGFFIAFSRIAQYQSLVILFSLLSVYLLSKAHYEEKFKNKGIILSFFFWGLGVLSHYDALFIFPIMIWLVYIWFKKYRDKKVILISFITAFTVAGIFYIPFVLSPNFSSVQTYLQNRVEGNLGVQRKLSSVSLFTVYNPKLIFKIYIILFFLSIIFKFKKITPVLAWFLLPFIVMEMIVGLPGTHIYTYMIPLTILCGVGFNNVYEKFKILRPLAMFSIVSFLLFNFYLSYFVYIDHKYEYPFETEKFLFWNLNKPDMNYSVPLFGFPYNKQWKDIAKYIGDKTPNAKFSSNEETQITRYYMRDYTRTPDDTDYYVRIVSPQSFLKDTDSKSVINKALKLSPEKKFYIGDKVVAEVFYLK